MIMETTHGCGKKNFFSNKRSLYNGNSITFPLHNFYFHSLEIMPFRINCPSRNWSYIKYTHIFMTCVSIFILSVPC